jgi:hypothetical protein
VEVTGQSMALSGTQAAIGTRSETTLGPFAADETAFMATTQIERQTVEQHRLDTVTMAVVLRQAVQQRAPVQLAASNVEGSGLWRGSFVRLATEGIEIAPDEPDVAIPQALEPGTASGDVLR